MNRICLKNYKLYDILSILPGLKGIVFVIVLGIVKGFSVSLKGINSLILLVLFAHDVIYLFKNRRFSDLLSIEERYIASWKHDRLEYVFPENGASVQDVEKKILGRFLKLHSAWEKVESYVDGTESYSVFYSNAELSNVVQNYKRRFVMVRTDTLSLEKYRRICEKTEELVLNLPLGEQKSSKTQDVRFPIALIILADTVDAEVKIAAREFIEHGKIGMMSCVGECSSGCYYSLCGIMHHEVNDYRYRSLCCYPMENAASSLISSSIFDAVYPEENRETQPLYEGAYPLDTRIGELKKMAKCRADGTDDLQVERLHSCNRILGNFGYEVDWKNSVIRWKVFSYFAEVKIVSVDEANRILRLTAPDRWMYFRKKSGALTKPIVGVWNMRREQKEEIMRRVKDAMENSGYRIEEVKEISLSV